MFIMLHLFITVSIVSIVNTSKRVNCVLRVRIFRKVMDYFGVESVQIAEILIYSKIALRAKIVLDAVISFERDFIFLTKK